MDGRTGKRIRNGRIFYPGSGRAIVVALSHGVVLGPSAGMESLPRLRATSAAPTAADAQMVAPGLVGPLEGASVGRDRPALIVHADWQSASRSVFRGAGLAIAAVGAATTATADEDRAALMITAVGTGEAWAVRTAERVGRLVGILIASLMPILLPDRVAIVGGTTVMGSPFFESVRATVDAIGGGPYGRDRPIVEGRYATMAGAVGAAALALKERRQTAGR